MGVTEGRLDEPSGAKRPRRRIPMSLALGLTIGTLMLIALGTILIISLSAAGHNTWSLLSDKANLMMEAASGRIQAELDPAADAAAFLAQRLESGAVPLDDPDAITAALTNAHAGLEQVTGIVFVTPDNSAIGVRKAPDGSLETGYFTIRMPAFEDALTSIQADPEHSTWGPPQWSDELQGSVLNVIHGVVIDGEIAGAIGIAVSVLQFSDFLGTLSESLGQNAFALIGDDTVLAHPLLAQPYAGLSAEHPLPLLSEFSDPILQQIWSQDSETVDELSLAPGIQTRWLPTFDDEYLFVFEKLEGYSDKPIIVGSYFRSDDIGREVERLMGSAGVGALITLLAVLLSFVVAKKISRPFTRVAGAAAQVGELALEEIEDLPGSRIREIDDQARAFNGMLRALRWLEIYVPRRLARRLLDATGGSVHSQDTEVTVMFTDIAGFTSWSEGREATEVADFLNAHFATLSHAIDDTGGTLDKFIGDGVMAFWGAPERQPDHAARACRAAVAIAAAVDAANTGRRARGDSPMRLRIGIHSGTVTIGNIGAPDRMNYTIVGDTVNVCQRLEQAGKDVTVEDGASQTVIVVSDAVADELPDPVRCGMSRFDTLSLRGRSAPIDTYLLDPHADPASFDTVGPSPSSA